MAERQSRRAQGDVGWHAHGEQGGRRGVLSGVAGRPGGSGHLIAVGQYVPAEHAGEPHRQGVGQTVAGGGVPDQFRGSGGERLPQLVTTFCRTASTSGDMGGVSPQAPSLSTCEHIQKLGLPSKGPMASQASRIQASAWYVS